MKILYVCPFAHHAGHPPAAAIYEPDALARAGAEVKLLTFYGIIDKTEVGVSHITMIARNRFSVWVEGLISVFSMKWPLVRWPILFLANVWTVMSAMWLKKKLKYDVIYLRDGEPFLIIPTILSLPFRGYRWVISLTGSGLATTSIPLGSILKANIPLFIYRCIVTALNSKFWRPFHYWSMKRNRFIFVTQSEDVKNGYNKYLGGVFAGKVVYLTIGCHNSPKHIRKEEAREHLGLPQDKPLLLSFGAAHPGKDLGVIFRGIKDIPDICLVQGWHYSFSTGQNVAKLVQEYAVGDKVIIREKYIPEAEKPFYFYAADAVVLSYVKQFTATASLLWEACSFGIPVIASDNGQLGEMVKRYNLGISFMAQDADSLKRAIIRFFNLEQKEIDVFKQNCYNFRDGWSIEKWAKNTMVVIEGLCTDC